ncbi:GNAT family N-acetyltransferase [Plantactinospora siamensis]|uniref:GNAT family N-acetyltransferase n=1 Tax=Plantactinospora siamensis TaxID=555372 RepID=A0ABV6P7I3_9ACTN
MTSARATRRPSHPYRSGTPARHPGHADGRGRPAGGPAAPGFPIVRRVAAADAARMRALRLEMLADSPLAFLETVAQAAARPHAEFAARVAECATGPRRGQFVADAGGRLVGHAGGTVAPYDPNLTVIFAVYLTPAWRGSGLLGELVEAVAAWSRECGRSDLLLEVVVGNDRAVRAYERLGFTDTGVRAPHPTVPVLTELQMRRPA